MPYIFRAIFLLRCAYCGRTSFRKKNSWFDFADGCERCNYKFEREEGYFLGAPWMINYPLTSVISIGAGIYFYRYTDLHSLGLAGLLSAIAISFGILFYPFARAIWMVGDHLIHPIQERDRLNPDKPLNIPQSGKNKS